MKLTEQNIIFIAAMRNDGATWSRVGSEFGVSAQTIHRAYDQGCASLSEVPPYCGQCLDHHWPQNPHSVV